MPHYGQVCLGIDGGVHPDIQEIMRVNPNPVNSVHGLVYDNYLNHGTVNLSCKRDCSRLDFPKAGLGAILPNCRWMYPRLGTKSYYWK